MSLSRSASRVNLKLDSGAVSAAGNGGTATGSDDGDEPQWVAALRKTMAGGQAPITKSVAAAAAKAVSRVGSADASRVVSRAGSPIEDDPMIEAFFENVEWHLGNALDDGDAVEVERLLRLSLEVTDESFQRLGAGHPLAGVASMNLARFYLATGRLEDAVPLLERRAAVAEDDLTMPDPDIAGALQDMVDLYMRTGRHREAVAPLDRALVLLRQTLTDDAPPVVRELMSQSLALERTGQPKRALAIAKHCLGVIESNVELDQTRRIVCLTAIARMHLSLDQPLHAEKAIRSAFDLRDDIGLVSQDESVEMLRVITGVIDAFVRCWQYDDAESLLHRGIRSCKAVLGPLAPATEDLRSKLRYIYLKRGKTDLAYRLSTQDDEEEDRRRRHVAAIGRHVVN